MNFTLVYGSVGLKRDQKNKQVKRNKAVKEHGPGQGDIFDEE